MDYDASVPCTFDCAEGRCLGAPLTNGSNLAPWAPGVCECFEGASQSLEFDMLGVEGDPSRAPCDTQLKTILGLWSAQIFLCFAYFALVGLHYWKGGRKTRAFIRANLALSSFMPWVFSILVASYRVAYPENALLGVDFGFTIAYLLTLDAFSYMNNEEMKKDFVVVGSQAHSLGISEKQALTLSRLVCKWIVPAHVLMTILVTPAIFYAPNRETKNAFIKLVLVKMPLLSAVQAVAHCWGLFQFRNILLSLEQTSRDVSLSSKSASTDWSLRLVKSLIKEYNSKIISSVIFIVVFVALHTIVLLNERVLYAMKYVVPANTLFFLLLGVLGVQGILRNRAMADKVSAGASLEHRAIGSMNSTKVRPSAQSSTQSSAYT